MIETRKLTPAELIGRTITLEQSIEALVNVDKFEGSGRDRRDRILRRKIANAVFTATGLTLSE